MRGWLHDCPGWAGNACGQLLMKSANLAKMSRPHRGMATPGTTTPAASFVIVIVCQDEQAARQRFGVTEGEIGIVYTRTGRRFFNEPNLEAQFLDRVRAVLTAANFWEELNTKWVCLDCELLPWSAKAQELLKTQYAAVGAAGQASLPRAVATLLQATDRLAGEERNKAEQVLRRCRHRQEHVSQFVAAYRHYCWPVASLTDLKLAPFHLLASEDRVHVDKNHLWHVDTLAKVCRESPELLLATSYKVVDVTDPASVAEGVSCWSELTGRGGEGMVVKPLNFILRGRRGLVQPAVKCRGREYLRIIYGPDYTTEENISRLRNRGLGHKRSLALGEFALGIEALERFVRKEPLRRVHECVFGVLALEIEPVAPRL
jgi:protein phosphatase